MQHTPATPLPWEHTLGTSLIVQIEQHVIIAATTKGRGGPVLPQRQNAAYIAHAANSYPKLVETLQLILDESPDDEFARAYAGQALKEVGED